MSYFNATQAALANGRAVISPRFVQFNFDPVDGGVVRLWEGAGSIEVDSLNWRGFAELGSISEASFGFGDAAGNITYTLSGVSPALITKAQDESASVRGRSVFLYSHFFDVLTLQPLDDFYLLREDIMDVLTYSGEGPDQRSISVVAETIWVFRNAASFAYFSDKDQKKRWPGDRGLEFVARMKDKRVRWPFDA